MKRKGGRHDRAVLPLVQDERFVQEVRPLGPPECPTCLAFPDAYARWEPLARQIVASPTVLSATCYSAADYVGDGSSGAKAVTAALQFLGTPYSWGGGGIAGPGRGFGPGSTTVGFDCASLVQYAYHQATGLTLPRVTDVCQGLDEGLPGVAIGEK